MVTLKEILCLKNWYAQAEQGQAFILQAGDCAEPFAEATEDFVFKKTHFLMQLGNALQNQLNKPVCVVGRIAGQYAKPRSSSLEISGDLALPCYRGDLINGFEFTVQAREQNSDRLPMAHACAEKTLQFIRIVLGNNLTKFFTSHEALLLDYEKFHTRPFETTHLNYNFGAHTVWLGERTQKPHGEHVDYLSHIANPIGIKLSARISEDDLVSLLNVLNPTNESGKINLITRLGCPQVTEKLPKLICAVKKAKQNVSWSVDPMHANTYKTQRGVKTRNFNAIVEETGLTAQVHKNENSILSGVHLEVSPFDVTECVGGECNLTENGLLQNYQTYCDPRLNQSQSFEFVRTAFT